MAKEESKSFNLKSLSAFNLLLNGVLGIVLSICSIFGWWWYESSLETPYKAVPAAPLLTKKIKEFNQTNQRFPNDSEELLYFLKVNKPQFLRTKDAFFLKNYVYIYRKLNEQIAILWAIPAPKLSEIDEKNDAELAQKIENIRENERRNSPLFYVVITTRNTKLYQGLSQQKLTDLDLLPLEPSTNQLNQLGLFEKK